MTLLLLGPTPIRGVQLDAIPAPLSSVRLPESPGLYDGERPIIRDRKAAEALGKSFFWDTAVGTDGMACASCHFHAGADGRIEGQFAAEGSPSGNRKISAGDFPFYRFNNPLDRSSGLLFSSQNRFVSRGSQGGRFQRPKDTEKPSNVTCEGLSSAGHGSRQLTQRHAPSVINAVFNYRNFWDGRASPRFNGRSVSGPRDPDARVWVVENNVRKPIRLLIENAGLASVAMEPPLNDLEMSCSGRNFEDIGQKLLHRPPLEHQEIHPEDSVLGPFRSGTGLGVSLPYRALIERAFDPRFWSEPGPAESSPGTEPAAPLEVLNFSFFFGLSIEAYLSTLIADQTPFDSPRDASGYPSALNALERRGLDLFNQLECDFCHGEPTLTRAAHPALLGPLRQGQPKRLVDRRVLRVDRAQKKVQIALMDTGFANTGVAPDAFDRGLGGEDPWGHPLSLARQYLGLLEHPDQPMPDLEALTAYDFSLRFDIGFKPEELYLPIGLPGYSEGAVNQALIPLPSIAQKEIPRGREGRLYAGVEGAFKVPGLRNVALTGPFMHNGSMKQLEEVVAFYFRGGNLENPDHFGTFVFQQSLGEPDLRALVAFLESLTDDRVLWERAPFDHPALIIPLSEGTRAARTLRLEAVGRKGRPPAKGPLQPFQERLTPN